MFKTEKQARAYVEWMKDIGKTHLVFKVPKGTEAHAQGGRYATCEASERAEYERGGAVFVDEVRP